MGKWRCGHDNPTLMPLVLTPGTEDYHTLVVTVTGEENAAPHDKRAAPCDKRADHPPVCPQTSEYATHGA